MSKHLLGAIFGMILPLAALAAGGQSVPLDHIETDITNQPSLQRGLQLFTNYCMGCHAMGYQRFQRNAVDLGIPEELYEENLLFSSQQKIGDLMKIAMTADRGKQWFGNPPPDLTLIARLRGPDWLYTYLRSFYADPGRPYGVNNTVFKDVGMPHVLMELQGLPRKGCGQVPMHDEKGKVKRDTLTGSEMTHEQCDVLIVDEEAAGSMSAAEYDEAIYDLVNFLEYAGEPSRLQSERIGVFALLYLVILFVVAYMLKREYWKDVH